MERYLTKSRFKLALECPTKLYYTKKKEYPDNSAEDSFLKSLAEGGFQVGELAKCYYPGGHDITESGYEKPLQTTAELMQQENVTIFEAAVRYKNLFIRIDILEKKGNQLRLIEVKAKSVSGRDETAFLNKSHFLDSGWKPYLYDIAFQHYALSNAFPEYEIDSYLMLADKDSKASINGLNQKFQLVKNNGRTSVKLIGDVNKDALGDHVLREVRVNGIIDKIYAGVDAKDHEEDYDFVEMIEYFSEHYEKDIKIDTPIDTHCAGCEFHTSEPEKKSGFKECWKAQTNLTDLELEQDLIFDIWNFSSEGNQLYWKK